MNNFHWKAGEMEECSGAVSSGSFCGGFATIISGADFPLEVLPGGRAPSLSHDGDACFDCWARVDSPMGLISILPNQIVRVPLGFKLGLRFGWEAQIRPRSGLTSLGILVILGTVDSGYRGEVSAIVQNASKGCVQVIQGMKLAQMAIRNVPMVTFSIEAVGESHDGRGDNGFGSTGG